MNTIAIPQTRGLILSNLQINKGGTRILNSLVNFFHGHGVLLRRNGWKVVLNLARFEGREKRRYKQKEVLAIHGASLSAGWANFTCLLRATFTAGQFNPKGTNGKSSQRLQLADCLSRLFEYFILCRRSLVQRSLVLGIHGLEGSANTQPEQTK